MGQKEKEIERRILSSLDADTRLFRINAGSGWQGKVLRHTSDIITLQSPRPFHGAPNGWPDLSGWRSIEITPDMVGRRIAVFYGVEIKAPSGGRKQPLRKEQRRMRDIVQGMGGVFEVVEE